MRTRERFEKALDQLMVNQIIADWHYVNWDENLAANKGWTKYWLNTSVVIEPANQVKEHYRSIEKRKKVLQSDEKSEHKSEADGQKLAERMLACRKERNITLLQLAEILQVSAPYISNIERNQAKPSGKLKSKIIHWLESK